MTKFAIRLLTALLVTALMAAPMVNAAKAAGSESPAPSADSHKDTKKKKHDKSSMARAFDARGT